MPGLPLVKITPCQRRQPGYLGNGSLQFGQHCLADDVDFALRLIDGNQDFTAGQLLPGYGLLGHAFLLRLTLWQCRFARWDSRILQLWHGFLGPLWSSCALAQIRYEAS
jgi:hypothetical protein